MRKSRALCVLLLIGLAVFLAGCATFPSQVLLDPARFENDAVRVEWAIGINFFRIKLTNITDMQIDLDPANSAIVSVDGEARLLSLVASKDSVMVPPRSYVILTSEHGAVYGTDILGRFNAETEDRYPLPMNVNADDRLFLKAHTGETIRLYLTADVRGKKTVYDITFKIAGATRVQQGRGAPEPAPVAAPAAPATPAPPAKGKP